MSFIRGLLSTEPALIVGLVTAAIALAASFHLPISDAQTQAIVGAVSALLALAASWGIRSQVYAPATVDAIIKSTQAGPPPVDASATPAG